MKQIHKTIPMPNDTYIQHYFSNSDIFLDIETTGFSPKYAFVYLIGIAVQKDGFIHIYQFLAGNRKEEAEILTAFHRYLTPGCTLITFNGMGFDIPFLKTRESLYSIPGNWESFHFTDLYKLTSKLSYLLQLPDKKQKSAEHFLGIHRDDTFSGGELIEVYYSYEKQQDTSSEALLLLHNYEDVLGMTKLLPLLSYRDLFEQPPQIQQAKIILLSGSAQNNREQNTKKELTLTLKAPVPFPMPCFCQKPPYSLTCKDQSASLTISVLTGEFKYYYDNYKDYYYLPQEDMAIHKSVAAYVDPAHRKRAAASNCYSKRNGDFLPQRETWFTPCFYSGKKTKDSYFEFTEEFKSDKIALQKYAASILQEFF